MIVEIAIGTLTRVSSRRRAVTVTGGAILLFGVPSALSGAEWFSAGWTALFGRNFFDTFDYLASNWFLPLGGLLIALIVGWGMKEEDLRDEFTTGSRWGKLFVVWYAAIRFVVPVLVLILVLYSMGLLDGVL